MSDEHSQTWRRMQEVSLDLADHVAAIDAFLTKNPRNLAKQKMYDSLSDRLDTLAGEIANLEREIGGDQLQELRAELQEQKRQRMELKRVLNNKG